MTIEQLRTQSDTDNTQWLNQVLDSLPEEMRGEIRYAIVNATRRHINRARIDQATDVTYAIDALDFIEASTAAKDEAMDRLVNPKTDADKAFVKEMAQLSAEEFFFSLDVDNFNFIDEVPAYHREELVESLKHEMRQLSSSDRSLTIGDLIERSSEDPDYDYEQITGGQQTLIDAYDLVRGVKGLDQVNLDVRALFGGRGVITDVLVENTEATVERMREFVEGIEKSQRASGKAEQTPTKYSIER